MIEFKPEKVKRSEKPLLIIGIGGTGTDALLTIKKKFNQRFIITKMADGEVLEAPEHTAYLAFDTDQTCLHNQKIERISFHTREFFDLSIPNISSYTRSPFIPSYIAQWWDNRISRVNIQHNLGAGSIRQVGRLALFWNASNIVTKLRTTIQRLVAAETDQKTKQLDIVLVTGITGGTGSGCFLDMAYLVHYVMDTWFHDIQMLFTAYIAMPEVNIDRFPNMTSLGLLQLWQANSFAALKELDYWMNCRSHSYAFEQQYSQTIIQKWDRPPFNDVVLIGDTQTYSDNTFKYNNCLDSLGELLLVLYAGEQYLPRYADLISAHQGAIGIKASGHGYISIGEAYCNLQLTEPFYFVAQRVFTRLFAPKDKDPKQEIDSRECPTMLDDKARRRFFSQFNINWKQKLQSFRSNLPKPTFHTFTPISYTGAQCDTQYDAQFLDDDLKHWKDVCLQKARSYAAQLRQNLYQNFKRMINRYMIDLQFAPFSLREFLADTQNGLLGFIEQQILSCDKMYKNIAVQIREARGKIIYELYPFMKKLPLIGRTKIIAQYHEVYDSLIELALTGAFIENLLACLKDFHQIITTYTQKTFPTIFNILQQTANQVICDAEALCKDHSHLNMIESYKLKEFVNAHLNDQKVYYLTRKVLESINELGWDILFSQQQFQTPDITEVRKRFEKTIENLIRDGVDHSFRLNTDTLLEIMMPQASYKEKQEFLSNSLLRNLGWAAKITPPIRGEKFVFQNPAPKFSYVSIPRNEWIFQLNVWNCLPRNDYLIWRIKYSDLTDRISWINICYGIPLSAYVNTQTLENVYKKALTNQNHVGLHLVYNANQDTEHGLHNDWSLIPSPV